MKARRSTLSWAMLASAILSTGFIGLPGPMDGEMEVVTIDSPSPLLQIRVMVKAGSAHDPAGKEGLASLTASALLDGGYGDADDPTTKEMVAERALPWGAGANPSVFVDKQSTTFSFTVPRDVLDRYIEQILEPLLSEPLFDAAEIVQLRDDALTSIDQLRFENIELVGLESLDNLIYEGTPSGHTVAGSVQGLGAITRDDVLSFYRAYYRPERLVLGVSSTDDAVVGALETALAGVGAAPAAADALVLDVVSVDPPPPVTGRSLTIIGLPGSGAAGVHVGFPIPITRVDPDWWALYVANIHFGTHRDSHSYLYERIRAERGYNYGDYSYVEHFPYRPFFLFQPWNAPRDSQYFSIWIRPVATAYAHHLLQAAVYELDQFIRDGLTDGEVERSKNKARVLYLNLAENTARLVEARVDDAFYGMSPGHLEGYLERIDAVTTEQVNAAIRRYLQVDDLKMLVVTEATEAEALAAAIATGAEANGKSLEEYRIDPDDMTPEQAELLELDAAWKAFDLGLEADQIRVVMAEELFETGALAGSE